MENKKEKIKITLDADSLAEFLTEIQYCIDSKSIDGLDRLSKNKMLKFLSDTWWESETGKIERKEQKEFIVKVNKLH